MREKREAETLGPSTTSTINFNQNTLLFENRIVPIWVSTKIAASILGISPNALRIRKCRGEIECRYFGKELRFNVNYLQSLFHPERVERSR